MARLYIGGAAPRQERQDRSDRPCAGGVSGRALSKDRRPHPHQRRAFLDGDLVVGAHSHRQLGQSEPLPELAERAEVPPRIAFRRRNAHQAQRRERRQRADLFEQCGNILRERPGLLRLAPDVHLQQHPLREAGRLRALRQLSREREPVAGVDERGPTHHQLRLVRLQRADEVPLHTWERVRLLAQILRVVLAEDRLPRRLRRAQQLDRLGLAHRDQADGSGVAPRSRARGRHPLAHPGETRGYVHGSSTPASASISSVSASGKPTTLVKLPSRRSTNAPARPCTAYAPALSSPSPEAASQRTCASDSGANVTAVSTERTSGGTQTAVITRCSMPERSRSMRSASDLSRVFPSTSAPTTTTVSAASVTWSARVHAEAFSRAILRT